MLSLLLSYYGGQRNRPRWIAWGVVICGISCFILAMPHFIYGAGDEALRLTKEFIQNEQELALLRVSHHPHYYHAQEHNLIDCDVCFIAVNWCH